MLDFKKLTGDQREHLAAGVKGLIQTNKVDSYNNYAGYIRKLSIDAAYGVLGKLATIDNFEGRDLEDTNKDFENPENVQENQEFKKDEKKKKDSKKKSDEEMISVDDEDVEVDLQPGDEMDIPGTVESITMDEDGRVEEIEISEDEEDMPMDTATDEEDAYTETSDEEELPTSDEDTMYADEDDMSKADEEIEQRNEELDKMVDRARRSDKAGIRRVSTSNKKVDALKKKVDALLNPAIISLEDQRHIDKLMSSVNSLAVKHNRDDLQVLSRKGDSLAFVGAKIVNTYKRFIDKSERAMQLAVLKVLSDGAKKIDKVNGRVSSVSKQSFVTGVEQLLNKADEALTRTVKTSIDGNVRPTWIVNGSTRTCGNFLESLCKQDSLEMERRQKIHGGVK